VVQEARLICRLVEVDDFVSGLWELYKEVAKEGVVQVLLSMRCFLSK